MRWIVGLDLRPRSAGAIQFARCLAAARRAGDVDEFVGVHVLEQEHLLAVLKLHHLDEVLAAARAAAEASVATEGGTREFSRIELLQGLNAPESLRDFAEKAGAEGILIGRAAPAGDGGLVRLGRIARRLLRVSTVPVVVVPPNVRADDLGSAGPVLALTKLTPDSVTVCRFAQRMAERLGRTLVIAHAVQSASGSAPLYLSPETLEAVRAERREQGRQALSRWIDEYGFAAEAAEILDGHVVEQGIALSSRLSATLVVAGARHASTLERLVQSSTGTELAAACPRPVAIVPPESR